jgi:hypothetical protein
MPEKKQKTAPPLRAPLMNILLDSPRVVLLSYLSARELAYLRRTNKFLSTQSPNIVRVFVDNLKYFLLSEEAKRRKTEESSLPDNATWHNFPHNCLEAYEKATLSFFHDVSQHNFNDALLQAYKAGAFGKNPELFKSSSPQELADLHGKPDYIKLYALPYLISITKKLPITKARWNLPLDFITYTFPPALRYLNEEKGRLFFTDCENWDKESLKGLTNDQKNEARHLAFLNISLENDLERKDLKWSKFQNLVSARIAKSRSITHNFMTLLFRAVRLNDLYLVKAVVSKWDKGGHPLVGGLTHDCVTEFQAAVYCDHYDIVSYLLSIWGKNEFDSFDSMMRGDEIETPTALFTAIMRKNAPMVKLLLTDERIDPKQPRHKKRKYQGILTPLEYVNALLIREYANASIIRGHEHEDSYSYQVNLNLESLKSIKTYIELAIEKKTASLAKGLPRHEAGFSLPPKTMYPLAAAHRPHTLDRTGENGALERGDPDFSDLSANWSACDTQAAAHRPYTLDRTGKNGALESGDLDRAFLDLTEHWSARDAQEAREGRRPPERLQQGAFFRMRPSEEEPREQQSFGTNPTNQS